MFDILKDRELLNNGLLSNAKMSANRLSVEDFVFNARLKICELFVNTQ